MRYERKYKIENISYSLVEQSIRLHPAGFQKLFPDRQVNNIYFDTMGLEFFKQSHEGSSPRVKIRLRWYGNFFNNNGKYNFKLICICFPN